MASQPNARGDRRDRELARDLLVSELAPLLRITPGAAAGLVAESRSLVAELPATLEARGAGRISHRHATTMVENAYSLPDEARAAYEHAVLRDAERLNVARFRDRARRVRERLHPDSISTRRRTQLERRSVAIDPGRDGMVWLSAYLPAETGVAIDDRLDRLAASMRDPADLRNYLRVRDETCRGVGCGRRAATSDIDHGQAWADGGPTSADNLAHLCRGDHTREHRLGWRAKHLPGGVMQWTSPFGRTYLTEPATVMRT